MNAPDPSSYSLDPTNEEDAELISYFISELPERIHSLREASLAGDVENIQRIAHQLKGAAPGFGFPAIGSAARDLELAAIENTTGSIESLNAEINALINLCRSYAKES
ncbi:MAG: Hpt domain-containing protein [Phycisphaerales bacterium]|nr:Hpt domain-containing protein [Phycisphaerales bacterium]